MLPLESLLTNRVLLENENTPLTRLDFSKSNFSHLFKTSRIFLFSKNKDYESNIALSCFIDSQINLLCFFILPFHLRLHSLAL